jgi:rhamnosyltransferase
MAHFDPDGRVAPHVRRQVEAWLALPAELVVVTTARLRDEDREWLAERTLLVERENVGYDFLSYQRGLQAGGDLSAYDEVVVCNDSFVGPLRPYGEIFDRMTDRAVDFWGIARSDRRKRHLQSYFLAFRRQVVAAAAFADFWDSLVPLASRGQVIRRYEVGLSRTLAKAGFRFTGYFRETRAERRRGRLRVAWWVLHRRPIGAGSGWARFWTDAREPWNPTYALADSALDGARLPLVKLDTLRHDPYGLNADRLLELCEQVYPAEFDGVRDFLDRTKPYYPTRTGEELRPSPWWLRPFAGLVAYRRP